MSDVRADCEAALADCMQRAGHYHPTHEWCTPFRDLLEDPHYGGFTQSEYYKTPLYAACHVTFLGTCWSSTGEEFHTCKRKACKAAGEQCKKIEKCVMSGAKWNARNYKCMG
jgi:hypothetical protein